MRSKPFLILTTVLLSLFLFLQGYATCGELNPKLNEAALSPAKEAHVNLPSGASASWWANVQEDIRKSAYNVTWQDQTYLPDIKAAYQAPNRAHNLCTYFTPEGIRIIPRASTKPEWIWGLCLRGYGPKGNIKKVEQTKPSVTGNRIEYSRNGFTEWYINSEKGLEQGFTLNTPPKTEKSDRGSWIVLKMDLYRDLNATLNSAINGIDFTTDGGVVVVHYGKLYAYDAIGQELPTRLALTGKVVDIQVDTNGAVYPITIDPLLTSSCWSVEGENPGSTFGGSVSTAGDVNGDGYDDVIVGSPYDIDTSDDAGRAYVYHGSASGLSTTHDWMAEGDKLNDFFGGSVSTAGDVNGDGYDDVIVGAEDYSNDQFDEGCAYVYFGSETGLSTTADWKVEGNQAASEFGDEVSTAGDVNGDGYDEVIVGAGSYDNGQTDEGMAFVWYGSSTGLGPDGTPNNADWKAESNQAGADFGGSVSTAGDVNGDGYDDVIVGASYDENSIYEGDAFVYCGSESAKKAMPAMPWIPLLLLDD